MATLVARCRAGRESWADQKSVRVLSTAVPSPDGGTEELECFRRREGNSVGTVPDTDNPIVKRTVWAVTRLQDRKHVRRSTRTAGNLADRSTEVEAAPCCCETRRSRCFSRQSSGGVEGESGGSPQHPSERPVPPHVPLGERECLRRPRRRPSLEGRTGWVRRSRLARSSSRNI